MDPPKAAGLRREESEIVREESEIVVPDLKLNEERDKQEQAVAEAGGPAEAPRARGRGPASGLARAGAAAARVPAALWRRHRLFTILALLSLLPRILATRAFRPALLTADSFLYMKEAATSTLGVIRPSGYSFFLRALEPFRSLLLVTTLQHLMGIAIAAIVYGLLRYYGLPAWGATLAAAPTLFDTREIALESYILPDTLYCLVIIIAVALLLRKGTPRLWQCALAGLLLAYASLLRGNGIVLVIVALAFMLIRRVGWRAFLAAAAASVVPLAGYATAYHASHGQFNLTSSDGIFLWSRTTSFANCAIIKPPPQLQPLCPDREASARRPPTPPWSVPALLNEPTAADYLWASDVWWRHDAHPGINAYNDKLGERFAIDAIKAQPLDYLRVAARDVALVFLTTDRPQEHETMTFTTAPHIAKLPSYYVSDLREYAHTTENTHPVQPYAYFLLLYQQPVYFPGLVFLFVVIAGLVGVIRRWRRWGGPQMLPWALATVSIAAPALLTQSLYRYTIVAIPLACLAAGLAFARQEPRPALAPAGATAAPGESPPGPAAPPAATPAPPQAQPPGTPPPQATAPWPPATAPAPSATLPGPPPSPSAAAPWPSATLPGPPPSPSATAPWPPATAPGPAPGETRAADESQPGLPGGSGQPPS